MPSKSYINPETSKVWTDTGGDKLLDLGGLTGTPKCGAYLDLGAAPRADMFEVELFIDNFASGTVSVGQTVDLFFTQSNATTGFDGRLTTDPTTSAEGTVSADQVRNLLFACSAVIISATATSNLIQARAVVRLTSRYVAPVVYNRTSSGVLKSSSDAHKVTLTPIPQEGQ